MRFKCTFGCLHGGGLRYYARGSSAARRRCPVARRPRAKLGGNFCPRVPAAPAAACTRVHSYAPRFTYIDIINSGALQPARWTPRSWARYRQTAIVPALPFGARVRSHLDKNKSKNHAPVLLHLRPPPVGAWQHILKAGKHRIRRVPASRFVNIRATCRYIKSHTAEHLGARA